MKLHYRESLISLRGIAVIFLLILIAILILLFLKGFDFFVPLSICLVSIAVISNALATHSGSGETTYDLDPAYKEPGKGEEPEMAFHPANSISPSYHASLFNLGKFYAESGQFQKALPLLENSRKEFESHFGTLLSLALFSYQKEQSKESHAILKEAEEQQGNQDIKRLIASCKGGR